MRWFLRFTTISILLCLILTSDGQAQLANTKIAFYSDRDGNREIYVMNPDGANVTQLTNNPTGQGDFTPSWSPDGAKIAFSHEGAEIYVMNADGTNQVNLTNNPALDEHPSWSPDGTKIAFKSNRDGNEEIYVMNADGTNQIRLTNNSATEERPRWSPDGKKIAFESSRDGNAEIYVMNADGTNQIRITNNSSAEEYPSWSPDGTKIAFNSNRDGNPEIYVMNADGTNPINLTNFSGGSDNSPFWSPDGTKITFVSDRDLSNNEIYVMNADGTNQIRLTNNPAGDLWPSWSPFLPNAQFSSTSLNIGIVNKGSSGTATFTVTNSGARTLSVSNITSSNPQFTVSPTSFNLTANASQTVTVTFRPTVVGWEQGILTITHNGANGPTTTVTANGIGSVAPSPLPVGSITKIVFPSNRDGNYELYVMNSDGTNQTRLTNNGFQASWSPDGTKLAFVSTRDNVNGEIYVMNADGTNIIRLTNNQAGNSEGTSWSPDGTKIAFASSRDGNGEIYVMNADGTNQTRLTNNSANDVFPRWSPDGTKFVFRSDRDGNWEIYVMNADGTNQIRLTNNVANDMEPSWSPDGTKIVFYSNRDGNNEIYVMNADGTNQIRITNNPAADEDPSWSPFIIPPTITSINPTSLPQGSANQNITITGTNFQPGATVAFSGTGITVNSVTFNSATQLTANITVASTAAGGLRDITVTNPDTGSGTKTGAFTVIIPPTITSLNPASRGQGATNQNITITGTNFQSNATVSFSGTGITVNSTTFNSSTQLTVNISIVSNATADSRNITVTNPDGGVGVLNNALTITPAPIPTVLNPTSRGQGATNQSIVITGTGFQNNATVLFSGTGITVNSTTFNSSTQLTVNLSIAANATADSRNITIANPDGGIGTLNGAFTINPAPTITSLNPASRGQGATNQNIVITGTGFQNNATVSFSGTGITVNSTTFNSSTQITVNISIASNATADSRNITVTNPDGGIGTGNGLFTITPSPTIASLNPSSLTQGSTNQNITILGANFQSGATVTFSGTGINVNPPVTFNSATQLTVNISIASNAALGLRDITVTNPDTGSGTKTEAFTITPPPICKIDLVNPNCLSQGASGQTITITGSNFQTGATVDLGAGITINSIKVDSQTQLTVNVSVVLTASTGQRDITVTNPDSGSCKSTFTVNVADGSGTVTVLPTSVMQGSTGNTLTFTFTAAGPMNGGAISITMPSGWSPPQGTFGNAGYTTIFSTGTIGNPAFDGAGTITIPITTLSTSQTITMNYGAGGGSSGAQAQATVGTANITVKSKGCNNGVLTNLLTQPSVNVCQISINPSSLCQGATNQNLIITGCNFLTGTAVSFSGTGVTLNFLTINSLIQLTANITIAPDATLGIRDVTVKNPDGSSAKLSITTISSPPIIQKFWLIAIKSDSITVSWKALDDVSAYEIFYSTDPNLSNATKLPIDLSSKPQKSDKKKVGNLTPNTKYYFKIRLVSANSNCSEFSQIISATTHSKPGSVSVEDEMEKDGIIKEFEDSGFKIENPVGLAGQFISVTKNDEKSAKPEKSRKPDKPERKKTNKHWEIRDIDVSVKFSARLVFSYTAIEIQNAGLNEDTMVIAFHDGSDWKEVSTERDKNGKVLRTTTNHFSTWTITEPTPLESPTITLVDTPLIATAGQPKLVKVEVIGQSAISEVKIFYLIGGQTAFSLKMFNDGLHSDGTAQDNIWATELPASLITLNGLAVYFTATDNTGNSTDITTLTDGTKISKDTAANVEVTGDITSPPIPIWKSPADWTMISFPVKLPNEDPEVVLKELGTPEVNWEAYQFNGGSDYDRAIRIARPNDLRGDVEKFTSIGSGKAAWIWQGSIKPATVTIRGAKSLDPIKVFAIRVNSGWNQISNPFLFSIPWNDTVKFGITNNVANAAPILKAAADGLIANPPIIYLRSGTGYIRISAEITPSAGTISGNLEPWKGYWFLSRKDGWLFIDPSQAVKSPPSIAPAYKPVAYKGWMLEIKANGIAINAGMEENALNAQDNLDFPTPPFAAKDSLRFAFAHPEWNDRFATHFDQDVRRLSRDGATWEIEVMSDGKPFTINWRQLYEVPREYMLMLVDPTTGASVDMKKETSYTLASEGSRKLYFVASISGRGIPEFLAKLIVKKTEVLQNFPNPFNPETWIPYQLAEASDVEIRIYDVSGRLVRRLSLGRSEAGIYINKGRAAYWDGRNDAGERVASGVYFYQLLAGSFSDMRKMLVVK